MRKLICLLMLCLLLPVCGTAETGMPYDPSLSLHYRQLTAEQQALLLSLHGSLLAGQTELTFGTPVDYDELSLVLQVLYTDFPELAGMSSSWRISYYTDAPQEAIGLRVRRDGPAADSLMAEAYAHLAQLNIGQDRQADALAIHDVLCAMTVYDEGGSMPHDARGPLLERRAVCEGYAEAMVLLYRLAGIPSSVVTGQAWNGQVWEPHAWVMLELNGVLTQTDVTWDDQADWISWQYCQMNDMQLQDHVRDDLSLRLPACTAENMTRYDLTGCRLPVGTSLRAFMNEKKALLLTDSTVQLMFATEEQVDMALEYCRYVRGFRYSRDELRHTVAIFPAE